MYFTTGVCGYDRRAVDTYDVLGAAVGNDVTGSSGVRVASAGSGVAFRIKSLLALLLASSSGITVNGQALFSRRCGAIVVIVSVLVIAGAVDTDRGC